MNQPNIAKLNALRNAIIPANSVLVVTHDYPDPDCLASAYALQTLFASWGVSHTAISYGGFAGRAENQAMIALLEIETAPFMSADFSSFERIVCVDCFPGKGNVSLPLSVPVHAVFDHHPPSDKLELSCYSDIREDIAATSTLMVEYLLAANCPIPSRLATALYYGIKSDTGDMLRDVSADDLAAYRLVFDIMNNRLLAQIERPERDLGYYRLIHGAIENAHVTGSVGFTHLGRISTPDYVAEMADFFFAYEQIEWMLCTGIFGDKLFFSVRSKSSLMAGRVAEKIAQRLNGSGGGHTRFAAGQIPLDRPEQQMTADFVETAKQVLKMKRGEEDVRFV